MVDVLAGFGLGFTIVKVFVGVLGEVRHAGLVLVHDRRGKVSGGNFRHGVTTGHCPAFRKELNIQLNVCMITTYEGYNRFSSYSRTTNHFGACVIPHVRSYLRVRSYHLPYRSINRI